ncbi:BRCT domain-containing protein [Leclercia adecarboxylata]|uniref:BRCT domain-containing protein n=1 Tax=Leclercia adecarboxylata TaxID=83655 RepID=UPI002DB6C37F|nr:BRCT domain-containing protein [Leclercia adecarboxylata]MEB6377605.1 BRCT domain-containing protein [Leclercia adecarboxylata]
MDTEYSKFNYAHNKDKLFANLISIIDGIISDGNTNKKEILYLDTWLMEADLLSRNYCVQAIRNRAKDVLSADVITDTELKVFKADLLKIQKQLIDMPDLDLYSVEADRHLLEGLCKGMLADHQLVDDEIRYLNWWLTNNGTLKNNYPGKELFKLVSEILKDGVITPEERESLKQGLTAYTGCDLATGIVDGMSTRLPVDVIESLDLTGAIVCLTGDFLYGKRSKCKATIEAAGATVCDNVTMKINYLIVGTLSSKDWMYQSYGRKIEKAVEYRDNKNIPLKIISEEQWQRFMA